MKVVTRMSVCGFRLFKFVGGQDWFLQYFNEGERVPACYALMVGE